MKVIFYYLALFAAIALTQTIQAHDHHAKATYLGNEAVMIQQSNVKIVFDPFFHNSYNTYQLVPDEIREALFAGTKPYNDINALFISHAHGDHFSAKDVLKFLLKHPKTHLIAPDQAISELEKLEGFKTIQNQIHPVALARGDPLKTLTIDDLTIEVVRIPHAGWPGRAEISNFVFRVTFDSGVTVMHMGDADPNDAHFKPYRKHWLAKQTDTAFPPYWFFSSQQGQLILDQRINTKTSIGIHVPVKVPDSLKQSDLKYFSLPGETKSIVHEFKVDS